jgi:hypothetical protein
MDNEMPRLILVPQYPTKLRYQEWWWEQFPIELKKHFDEVVVLGKAILHNILAGEGKFAPINASIGLETMQIDQYMQLDLLPDDVLLLNDLSFPGLFANVLFHKKPKYCFAICHATSKNKYDYFQENRAIKYPIEKATSKLFNTIFVASEYHKNKLGWSNIDVLPFPYPPFIGIGEFITKRFNRIVSASRPGIQKRNLKIEKRIEKEFKCQIRTPNAKTWEEYYEFLGDSRVLLITAKEETFGYQIIDAVRNGCIPVAPNALCYKELLPSQFLYDDTKGLIDLLNFIFMNPGLLPPTLLIEKESKDFYRQISNYMKAWLNQK